MYVSMSVIRIKSSIVSIGIAVYVLRYTFTQKYFYGLQVNDKKSKPHIEVDIGGGQMKTFAPEEISAMVLTKMKETAEAYLGKKV